MSGLRLLTEIMAAYFYLLKMVLASKQVLKQSYLYGLMINTLHLEIQRMIHAHKPLYALDTQNEYKIFNAIIYLFYSYRRVWK